GYGTSRGFAAIPRRWKVALILVGLAALAFVWSRARRFGPPDQSRRALPPARAQYVDALSVSLERTRDHAGALAPAQRGARAGVAKTLLANAFARAIGVEFRRVQFTPDMLPADLTGTMTLRAGELVFRPGPVFTNLLLADEINRTPPKTQAALLEAMQERQVS